MHHLCISRHPAPYSTSPTPSFPSAPPPLDPPPLFPRHRPVKAALEAAHKELSKVAAQNQAVTQAINAATAAIDKAVRGHSHHVYGGCGTARCIVSELSRLGLSLRPVHWYLASGSGLGTVSR